MLVTDGQYTSEKKRRMKSMDFLRKPKRGRPKLKHSRTASGKFYMLPEVKSRLLKAAQRKHLTESDWLLNTVLKQLIVDEWDVDGVLKQMLVKEG